MDGKELYALAREDAEMVEMMDAMELNALRSECRKAIIYKQGAEQREAQQIAALVDMQRGDIEL